MPMERGRAAARFEMGVRISLLLKETPCRAGEKAHPAYRTGAALGRIETLPGLYF